MSFLSFAKASYRFKVTGFSCSGLQPDEVTKNIEISACHIPSIPQSSFARRSRTGTEVMLQQIEVKLLAIGGWL